jgi:DNA polymerase-3 subunit gamma/tau
MYQVIARKWRPQAFDEVTGQDHIIRTLCNAVGHERLHHAYLFSGARGVGKTTTARLLAKALNCHKSDKPCSITCAANDPTACPSCREIAESRSIDVQEIDAASTTGVQNVRDSIIDTVGISPARDRYKIFIIDEVHMLSTPAFNALLKTLEEPPPRVVFIMATTERHKLPDTILSRCQQFEFRTIAAPKIAERLRLIADAEAIKVSDDALNEIARAGEGSMRDAQSAFDQVISFAGNEIKTEDVEAALGIAGREILARVIEGIAESKPEAALAVVDDLVMRGHDLRNFCRDVLGHIRDLLVVKVSGDTAGVLDSTGSDRKELQQQAAAFSESDLVRFFHSLSETETSLRTATHPRYQLEIGLVKLMEMRRLAPLQELVKRLDALEESLRGGNAPPPGKPSVISSGGAHVEADDKPSRIEKVRAAGADGDPERPVITRPKNDVVEQINKDASHPPVAAAATAVAFEPPQPSEAAEPIALNSPSTVNAADYNEPTLAPSTATGSPIEQLKAALEKKRKMLLVTALETARKASLEGNELVVEFTPENKHMRDELAKIDNVKFLREVAREVFGFEIGIRISVVEPSDQAGDGPMSKADEDRREKKRLREIAEKHPSVQGVLEAFRGEIVEVGRIEPDKKRTRNAKPDS